MDEEARVAAKADENRRHWAWLNEMGFRSDAEKGNIIQVRYALDTFRYHVGNISDVGYPRKNYDGCPDGKATCAFSFHYVDAPLDFNAKNNDGSTALMLASHNGHLDVVEALLADSRIHVNIKNNDGDTALMLASLNGHLDIVKLLLADPRVDVNTTTKYGWTALANASFEGHLDIVKLLLKAGPTYFSAALARDQAAEANHPRIYRAIDRWMQGYYQLRFEIEGEGGIGAPVGAIAM